MSFTPGQLVFAVVFAAGFLLVLLFSYKADKKYLRNYYRGSWKVILGIAGIGFGLWLLVRLLSTQAG